MEIIQLASLSVIRFFYLCVTHTLHLRYFRIGKIYILKPYGSYAIFRETVNDKKIDNTSVVLVVGFRLRLIKSHKFLHWLFQRICIFTTPFWSGFRGFHIKLWMVDPKSKNYLGIYDWYGKNNAQIYVNALLKVLRPLSTKESVWYELYDNQSLNSYLQKHEFFPAKALKNKKSVSEITVSE